MWTILLKTTQNLADPQEEEDVPTSSGVVAARSKAKAKPQPRESIGTTTIPLCERKWIDIEPSKQDLESYDLSKKVINLLRHNQTLHREEDGAIEFYTFKFYLRGHHSQIQNWSDDRWIACLAAGGGPKRRYQYCSDNLGSIVYLRAFQGHSGSNLIDPALQDKVLIGLGIFPYIYHVGSNFNLHSIISNGLILGGQNLSRRQTVFFFPVDPRNENHKDPEYIDYSAPRLARYLQNAWKRHQDTVFWVDIDLGIREGLMFYQTRSNAIILQGTLQAHKISKVERLKNGEMLYERRYLSPRPPPKISLKHDLNWRKGNDQGSTVEHRPVGKLVQQSLQSGSSKPTQPNSLNPLKIERGNPLPKRLLVSCKKNLVLPIDRGNPIERKKNASWKITIDQGNPIERKDCTKCKKMLISKIVMMRISSTLQWMTRTLISTSPVFPMRRWNALKALTFMTWFRKSKVIHKKKQFRMISNSIDHSIPSPQSQKLRLWLLETLRFARLSTWSRSYNARFVLSIAVQELYTAHVDNLWQRIPPRIDCTSQLCLIASPYRTSTSERTGHTVTGMEKHLDAKITIRRINLQRNVVKRSMTASTTDSSATKPSGRRWLKWDALKRSSRRWISLQVKTTLTKPLKQKLTSTVAIGGFTQTWQTSIRCQQGINLISRRRCRHCTASRKRRTRSNIQNGNKVPPLLRGNGKQTGGSPIMSTHHKDGMTTDLTRYFVANYSFAVWVSARIEFKIFIVNFSVTADGSLLSPTGGVHGIHLAPEIHEHIYDTTGYGTLCTTSSTLSPTLRPLWPTTWTPWLTQTS